MCPKLVPGDVSRPPTVPEQEITPFSANVSWNSPADPNGEIIQYTVNVYIVSNDMMSGTRERRQTTLIDSDCVIGGMDNVDRNITVTGEPPNTFIVLENLSKYLCIPLMHATFIDTFCSSKYCV